jgi:hypothetical protein
MSVDEGNVRQPGNDAIGDQTRKKKVDSMIQDVRLQRLAERCRECLGLGAYELHAFRLHPERGVRGFIPVLVMEWFPKGVEMSGEEGINPEGTAVVEADLRNGRLRRVVFVGGKTWADKLRFRRDGGEQLIGWLERETGLEYERHFRLKRHEENEFVFAAHIHGIPLSPAGRIDVKLDDQGRLVLFSVYGEFPDDRLIRMEDESLSFDPDVERLAYAQLKLVTMPLVKRKRWARVYAMEEILVSRDKRTLLPYLMEERTAVPVDRVLEWREPLQEPFHGRPLFPRREDWTVEQALALAEQEAPYALPEPVIDAAIEQVTAFLRKKYPQDSGKWRLKAVTRDASFLIADLRPSRADDAVPEHKLRVFLDAGNGEVLHYLDNGSLRSEIGASLAPPNPVAVTKEEAFARLRERMTFSPVYAYDPSLRQYRLCGLLDCACGVMADSGEVVELDDL